MPFQSSPDIPPGLRAQSRSETPSASGVKTAAKDRYLSKMTKTITLLPHNAATPWYSLIICTLKLSQYCRSLLSRLFFDLDHRENIRLREGTAGILCCWKSKKKPRLGFSFLENAKMRYCWDFNLFKMLK